MQGQTVTLDFPRGEIRAPFSEQEYEKAEKVAERVIRKIQGRLPAPCPLGTQRNFGGVYAGFPHIKLFYTDGEKLFVYDDFRAEICMEEEELVEHLVKNTLHSIEFQPFLTNKLLGDLNNNFEKLFSFLRESIELVPGSERVKNIQEHFETSQ